MTYYQFSIRNESGLEPFTGTFNTQGQAAKFYAANAGFWRSMGRNLILTTTTRKFK